MIADATPIRPVILCGGAGTRLWPVSRQTFPKQLLPVTGEQSLLQETAARLSGDRFAPALIVSGEEQRFFIKRQLIDIGAPVKAILLEPAGRNTSAAAALAAAWLLKAGSDDLMLLMPSDHVIGDRAAFIEAIESGCDHAQAGAIVTFGATPTEPNTQYGYIEAGAAEQPSARVRPIARFVEKPDAETASEYFSSGRFFWNAGIFLVKASTLIDEMRRYLPDSLDAIERSVAAATTDELFVRPQTDAFLEAKNISIDHAIMEKTNRGMVVPVSMKWSDVGSWDAVWKLGDKDHNSNVVQGDVVALDTRNSLLRNDSGSTLAVAGLDNMAVIAVRDAVLIAPLERMADLKSLVAEVQNDRVVSPAKVFRPWGSYESISSGPGFQVKTIVVEPGQTLSLQLHHQRSEHWVVVRGTAEVTVGDEVSMLGPNQSVYIPVETKHRLANPGDKPLELIEVQCGGYLGEDDIVRFDDVYGRTDDVPGS
ncbi:mannose-1-phosphate guanylyltransferase/mannose-6-phosphate isomerase [Sphingomonas flavescens]|uniref:mannose-1-phosphate guanylyltransferase/mannose-6-phosphate isomerase n=1 Tax=Sphingomonas flavescens TaxID=3132797 RepID=UPI002804E3AF|nr:mannose-1-phosphate guanylyltransferase/mannose-6-phosphate isomerase [Sphingomonas limnosediminicola]